MALLAGLRLRERWAIGTANRTHPGAGRTCPCGGSCPSSNTGRGIGCVLRREEVKMPLVTVFNLRRDDPLADLEEAIQRTLTSIPELAINDWEVNVVPVLLPDGFDGEVTRINVDLWERAERTKDALQELATRVAEGFQAVVGGDRKVKVVIRPYDVDSSGWVSL
jgi:hypothetical protein